MADSNNKLIIILSAVLLAVMTVSAVIFVLIPPPSSGLPEEEGAPAAQISPGPSAVSDDLDLSIFNRQLYRQLDMQPIRDGSLPVQPPVQVGKANPFL